MAGWIILVVFGPCRRSFGKVRGGKRWHTSNEGFYMVDLSGKRSFLNGVANFTSRHFDSLMAYFMVSLLIFMK